MGRRILSLFKSSNFLSHQLSSSNLATVPHIHLAMSTKPPHLNKYLANLVSHSSLARMSYLIEIICSRNSTEKSYDFPFIFPVNNSSLWKLWEWERETTLPLGSYLINKYQENLYYFTAVLRPVLFYNKTWIAESHSQRFSVFN